MKKQFIIIVHAKILILIINMIIINFKNFIYINYFKSNKKTSICLCTVGKKENNYVKEYVDYYFNYGVNKIIIYDNNDINGEHFDMLLSDFINNKTVEIINCRGLKKVQLRTMNHCYFNNYKVYNWLIFYDMDEFIYLKNYSKIKDFLNEKKFHNCQIISLTSIFHTDNNHIYYENKSLLERFPNINRNITRYAIKSILRGNIPGLKIVQAHYLMKDKNISSCSAFGHKIINISCYSQEIDTENYYINHYAFKSTEEFTNKITRGDVAYGYNNKKILGKINNYFRHNLITMEKIIIIEKKTGLKLNYFRRKLKSHKTV